MVFNRYDAAIHLDALAKPENVRGINAKPNKFYNSTGPARQGLESIGDDDIYISCQPTGSSEEQEVVEAKRKHQPTFSQKWVIMSLKTIC